MTNIIDEDILERVYDAREHNSCKYAANILMDYVEGNIAQQQYENVNNIFKNAEWNKVGTCGSMAIVRSCHRIKQQLPDYESGAERIVEFLKSVGYGSVLTMEYLYRGTK